MGIEGDFIPAILFAKQIEKGIRFAMCATIAVHRDVLERIGGLASIADYLADDYELGRRVSEAGFEVEVADCVVDHYLPRYSRSDFFQHQLRWARTVRSCRPEGYAGLILTFALPCILPDGNFDIGIGRRVHRSFRASDDGCRFRIFRVGRSARFQKSLAHSGSRFRFTCNLEP